MDTCALCLVGLRDVETFSAKMTFATARLALIELSRIFELAPKTNAADRLPAADFQSLSAQLSDSGIVFSAPEEAEQRLNEFRATYEPFLLALSDYLLIPLPALGSPPTIWRIGRIVRAAEALRRVLNRLPPIPSERLRIAFL
jgi:hypothetical protein